MVKKIPIVYTFLNMFICHKGILYIVITFSLYTKYYTQKSVY